MNYSFGDVIGIASLLFALVGLLGTFFFLTLTQWLNSVLATRATWNRLVEQDPDGRETGSRLDCYHKAREARSWVTVLAWFVISAFLTFVIFRVYELRSIVVSSHKQLMTDFVVTPCLTFFIVYLILSIVFLIIGMLNASQVISEYEN